MTRADSLDHNSRWSCHKATRKRLKLTHNQVNFIPLQRSSTLSESKEKPKRTPRGGRKSTADKPTTSRKSLLTPKRKKIVKKESSSESEEDEEIEESDEEPKRVPSPSTSEHPQVEKPRPTKPVQPKKVSLPKASNVASISRIGMDPKQSVAKKPDPPFKSFSSYKIPKKPGAGES